MLELVGVKDGTLSFFLDFFKTIVYYTNPTKVELHQGKSRKHHHTTMTLTDAELTARK